MNSKLKILSFLVFFAATGILHGTAWENYNTSNSRLPDNTVNFLLEDLSGIIWAGTNSGISLYNGVTWENYDKYSSSTVFSIAVDRANKKWFGLHDRIISSFGDGIIISSYVFLTQDIPIRDIAIEEDYIWLASVGKGVYRIENGTHTAFQEDPHPDDTISLPENNVFAITITDSGEVWAGTEKGASRFNRDAETWTTYRREEGSQTTLPANRINSIFEDSSGNLWFGTTSGLSLKESGGSMDNLKNYYVEDGLPSNTIRAITQDTRGSIWVATSSGVGKYDGISWIEFNAQNSGLASNNVFALTPSRDGGVWFGTDRGVGKFLRKDISLNRKQVLVQGGAEGFVNPDVGDQARIFFNAEHPGKAEIRIFTSRGMLIWETSKDTSPGMDYVTWDCRNLSGNFVSSGVYTVHIKAPGVDSKRQIPVIR